MREIFFRGKRKYNGQWITGYYMRHMKRKQCSTDEHIKSNDIQDIILFDGLSVQNMPRGILYVEIDINTLGQWTGLTDCKNNKIFEGDIICARYSPVQFPNHFVIGYVIFENGTFKINVTESKNEKEYKEYAKYEVSSFSIEHNFIDRGYTIEVIGNIYDHSELLQNDLK